jgi:hypothetical protein
MSSPADAFALCVHDRSSARARQPILGLDSMTPRSADWQFRPVRRRRARAIRLLATLKLLGARSWRGDRLGGPAVTNTARKPRLRPPQGRAPFKAPVGPLARIAEESAHRPLASHARGRSVESRGGHWHRPGRFTARTIKRSRFSRPPHRALDRVRRAQGSGHGCSARTRSYARRGFLACTLATGGRSARVAAQRLRD